MHQEYCRTFFTSLARSVICLALVAPVCDNADADDKLKGPHSTPRTVAGSSGHSSGFHHSLQGHTPSGAGGIHTNNSSYRGGLNRNQGRQDHRKKQSVTSDTGITTNTNNSVQQFTGKNRSGPVSNLKTPERSRRIVGNYTQHEQDGKHTGRHTANNTRPTEYSGSNANIKQGRYTGANRNNNGGYKSIGYGKHYDKSRGGKVASADKYSGKNDKNRFYSRTHHNHHEYRNKYSKHKKYLVKRYPLGRLIFIGYSLVPFSYYTYYNYYYPGELAYLPSVYGYNENNYSPAQTYDRENSGWVQLSNGQIMEALNSFSREMEHYPDAGIPKVGYALAAAASGDLISAVLAMREALRYDPDSLQYIYLDERLFDLVDSLTEKYEYQLQFDYRRPDEAFMTAALYYLEQDYISAHNAVGRAISDGDKSVSINNLHGIINAKLQENYAGDYN